MILRKKMENEIFKKIGVLVGLFLVVWLISLWQGAGTHQSAEVLLGGQRVTVAVASTPEEHSKGLSDKPSLPYIFEDKLYEGMLFIFETDGDQVFWMKDMNFSLDIIWLDSNKNITHIENNVLPESFPETFRSPIPSQYVLELGVGFVEKYDLRVGDYLSWEL